jgi:DNA polymerase-1
MIMQVHDELVFEVHKDDLDAVSKKIHELMESSMTLDVPLLVEVGSGKTGIKLTKYWSHNALFM